MQSSSCADHPDHDSIQDWGIMKHSVKPVNRSNDAVSNEIHITLMAIHAGYLVHLLYSCKEGEFGFHGGEEVMTI